MLHVYAFPGEFGGSFRAEAVHGSGWPGCRGMLLLVHALGKRSAEVFPIARGVLLGYLEQVFKLILGGLPITGNTKVQSVHDSPRVRYLVR
jgi:hypothetical protein